MPGAQPYFFPGNFTVAGNALFFYATETLTGLELWKLNLLNSNCPPTSTWTGNTSTAWEEAANWTNGVPCVSTAVVVPAGRMRYPVVNNNTAVKTVTAAPGSTVNVSPGINITINGN